MLPIVSVAIFSSLSSLAFPYPSVLLFKCFLTTDSFIPIRIYTCCSLLHVLILQLKLALTWSCLKDSSVFCHVLTNHSFCPSPFSCYCQGFSWCNCQPLRMLHLGFFATPGTHPLPPPWASLPPCWHSSRITSFSISWADRTFSVSWSYACTVPPFHCFGQEDLTSHQSSPLLSSFSQCVTAAFWNLGC